MIDTYDDNPYCLELIQFFGWHPATRFSELAILHALSVSGERRYITKALSRLVDNGAVKTYSENGIALYCLTDEEPLRQAALDIARLDWSQWQLMLRQSHAQSRSYLLGHAPDSAPAVSNS
jgi:hypothetical protein